MGDSLAMLCARCVPPALCHAWSPRAVLGLSFVVEGYSLLVATRSVVAGAAAAGLGTMEFIKRGMDPTSIAVMLEDGAAVTGLVIAGAAGA
jgi:zinc transporter 9